MTLASTAARNNAAWCDRVCRTHGIDTAADPDAWVARRRSPPMYPDAVTLSERPPVTDLLARIDRSPGCTIKDSFASVDLSGEGFRPLFDAEWIHRPPVSPAATPGPVWSVVETAGDLADWATAHGGGDTFRPALLDDPAVTILAAHDDGALVAGVIGNRDAGAAGLSNLFVLDADPDVVWAGASAAVSAAFPGLPLVGYEHGEDLDLARRAGFVTTGPLRVWIADRSAVVGAG